MTYARSVALWSMLCILVGSNQLIAGQKCPLIQRLTKVRDIISAYDKGKLASALNWMGLSDANLIAFLSRFEGLAEKRALVKARIADNDIAVLADIVVISLELTQVAVSGSRSRGATNPRIRG